MRMEQGVRTALGQGASSVSYRHNFLVIYSFSLIAAFGPYCSIYTIDFAPRIFRLKLRQKNFACFFTGGITGLSKEFEHIVLMHLKPGPSCSNHC